MINKAKLKLIITPKGNTPIATFFNLMSKYPGQFSNEMKTMENVFLDTGYTWNKNGDIVEDRGCKDDRKVHRHAEDIIGLSVYTNESIIRWNTHAKFRHGFIDRPCLHPVGSDLPPVNVEWKESDFYACPLAQLIRDESIKPSNDWLWYIEWFIKDMDKYTKEIHHNYAKAYFAWHYPSLEHRKMFFDRSVNHFKEAKEKLELVKIRLSELIKTDDMYKEYRDGEKERKAYADDLRSKLEAIDKAAAKKSS